MSFAHSNSSARQHQIINDVDADVDLYENLLLQTSLWKR